MEDEHIFDRLANTMRKVLGLEMEAAVIGAVQQAYRHDIPWMIVMKGVQDFADPQKNDNFRHFAARASAECLIGFLRENLPPSGSVPGFDDILDPGKRPLPDKLSPSALLDSRYQIVTFYEEGRRSILEELDNWLQGTQPVRARLFYGLGGIGKTRLMAHWCALLRNRGWQAGFLREPAPVDWFERLCAVHQPTLVVIDYAESRAHLQELLAAPLRAFRIGGKHTPYPYRAPLTQHRRLVGGISKKRTGF